MSLNPRGRLRALFYLPLLLFAASASSAPLVFTLSSPDDLTTLTVGQTAHVNVPLSGLAPGENLLTLLGGVKFDASLFASPPAILAGAIVPNPLANPSDFQTV